MQPIPRNIVKRVYTRIFTATLNLLQLCWIFFFCKINTKFSVPCLKCRSVQELWVSVHCTNHKYIGMFWYWSDVSKVVRISPYAYVYSTAQAIPPSSNRENLYVHMRHSCTMHTCTIETFLFIFHLDHNVTTWNRYLKVAHTLHVPDSGLPKHLLRC